VTLPEVQVISRGSPPSRSGVIESGTWFVTGLSDRGPVDRPELVRNLGQFQELFGARQAYGANLYDSIDAFFKEGGARVYVSRVVGPAAAKSTATLSDGTDNTATVTAKSPGGWANGVSLVVTHPTGATFKVDVREGGVTKETTPELSSVADFVAWAANSAYIAVTDLGNDIPTAATTPLAGGDDDRAAITETQWKNALGLFGKDLGPGQVSAPGRTTAQAQTDLLDHAAARNRVALIDLPDTATVSTLTAAAATLRALTNSRYGGAFAPWAVIPGIATGTQRVIPPSAIVSGIIARNDSAGLSTNVPAAGGNGIARYATDLSQGTFADVDREALNDAGVNVLRSMFNGVRIYGYRTMVNGIADETWLDLSNARLNMVISAEAHVIGEVHQFRQIDGRGIEIGKFEGDLRDMLKRHFTDGSLFGASPSEAFDVDAGPQVNTPQSIAGRELHAILAVRMSPFAEKTIIEISKVPDTEAV
jgi:phage tail sheath protein FI